MMPQTENTTDFTTIQIENNLSKIIEGLNETADIISSTMGGAGKNVILNSKHGLTFTKDGVSVAKSINLNDPIKNIGSKLLINATNKTVEQCGDGTTLTSLLTKTIVNEMLQSKEDINTTIESMDAFIIEVEDQLKNRAKKVESIQQIYEIAKTASKSPSVGKLISEIYSKTGYGAKISVEISQANETTDYQLIEGLTFESGLINSRFANQEENGSCVLENCTIVLEPEIVSDIEGYSKIFEGMLSENKESSLLIIAPQFADAFVKFCVSNVMRVGLKVCLIKSPGYGKAIQENYKDTIAFSNDMVIDKVVVTPYDCTMYNTTNPERIAKRTNQLSKLAAAAVENYDEADYLMRIERLKQTGAIIYVGGVTLKNAKEEFDRIEDAVGAVSSALKLGYVRGAGCELAAITADSAFGVDGGVLRGVDSKFHPILLAPLKQILANANIVRTDIKFNKPYNVISKQYDDTIIDPAFVLINSFKNANALAKLLINTSYTLHNE